MRFAIVIELPAGAALRALPIDQRRALKVAIEGFGENPRPDGHVRLRPDASGERAYRLRVADVRLVYTIDDDALRVRVILVRR